ncbi:MAG: hypothetical protein ACAI25_03210, partial [Planctomycetota bacterium]
MDDSKRRRVRLIAMALGAITLGVVASYEMKKPVLGVAEDVAAAQKLLGERGLRADLAPVSLWDVDL